MPAYHNKIHRIARAGFFLCNYIFLTVTTFTEKSSEQSKYYPALATLSFFCAVGYSIGKNIDKQSTIDQQSIENTTLLDHVRSLSGHYQLDNEILEQNVKGRGFIAFNSYTNIGVSVISLILVGLANFKLYDIAEHHTNEGIGGTFALLFAIMHITVANRIEAYNQNVKQQYNNLIAAKKLIDAQQHAYLEWDYQLTHAQEQALRSTNNAQQQELRNQLTLTQVEFDALRQRYELADQELQAKRQECSENASQIETLSEKMREAEVKMREHETIMLELDDQLDETLTWLQGFRMGGHRS